MHSPSVRTVADVSRRRDLGVLARLIGLVLLCAAALSAAPVGCEDPSGAVAPPGLRAVDAAASATSADRTVSATAAFGERGEDRGDRPVPATDGEGALDEVAVTELDEETDESPASPGVAWCSPASGGQSQRRPDPIVAWRAARIAPTRGPPAVARTVG